MAAFDVRPDYQNGGVVSATGFTFAKRNERVDWKRIAAVDIDRVSRELDFQALQDNIRHITFCSIEQEVDLRYVDPNFIKLFKLAQLNIEYLLHSQEYLTSYIQTLEVKIKDLVSQLENEKQKRVKGEEAITELKRENKRQRKTIENQQQSLAAASTNDAISQCPYCPKAFFKPFYLDNHIARRHPGQPRYNPPPPPPPPPLTAPSVVVQDNNVNGNNGVDTNILKELEREVNELRTKITDTEALLQEEKMLHVALKQRFEDESYQKEKQFKELMESWKKEQVEKSQETVEKITDMFMKELKGIHDHYKATERALEDLDVKYSKAILKTTHLGELTDFPRQNNSTNDEIQAVKDLIKTQLTKMSTEIENKLEDYDSFWKKKLKTLNLEQSSQLKEFMANLEQSLALLHHQHLRPPLPSAPPPTAIPAAPQTLITQACSNAEQQIQKLITVCQRHEKQLQVLASHSRSPSPQHVSPPPEAAFKRNKRKEKVPKQEEELIEVSYRTPHPQKPTTLLVKELPLPHKEPEKTILTKPIEEKLPKDSLQFTPQGIKPSSRLSKAITHSPSLIQGLRTELNYLLEDKLKTFGVNPEVRGITKDTLHSKLKLFRKERSRIKQKYGSNYYNVREKIEEASHHLAAEKLEESFGEKTSPSFKSDPISASSFPYPTTSTPKTILKKNTSLMSVGKKTSNAAMTKVTMNKESKNQNKKPGSFSKNTISSLPRSSKKVKEDVQSRSASDLEKELIYQQRSQKSISKELFPSTPKKKNSFTATMIQPKAVAVSETTPPKQNPLPASPTMLSESSFIEDEPTTYFTPISETKVKEVFPVPVTKSISHSMPKSTVSKVTFSTKSSDSNQDSKQKDGQTKKFSSQTSKTTTTQEDSDLDDLASEPEESEKLSEEEEDKAATSSDWEGSVAGHFTEVKPSSRTTSVSRLAKDLEAKLTFSSQKPPPPGAVHTLKFPFAPSSKTKRTADSYTEVETFKETPSETEAIKDGKASHEQKESAPVAASTDNWDSESSLDEVFNA